MATSGIFSLPSFSGSDEVHERVCSLCSKEDKDVVAVELCLDCEQLLCRSCSVQHGRFKSLQNHKVVQRDQVPDLSLSVLKGSEEAGFECTVCTIYGRYTAAKIYCMHCCKYLCSVCENNHNLFGLLHDHKIKEVDKIKKEVNKSQSEVSNYAVIVEKPIHQAKLSCASCRSEIEDTQQLLKCIHCGFRNTCQKCCGLHQSSNEGHRLIPYKEFKVIYQQYGKSIMSGSGEFMGPVCSKCCEKGFAKHPHMFCKECNIFVCISCKEDHASHRTESDDALGKAIADEIVQMENIEHDCSICLDRNLRSSAAGYCLKCDAFICVGCTKMHTIYFGQESHHILGFKEINWQKKGFFQETLYSASEIMVNLCYYCYKKEKMTAAAWQCTDCQKSLCMSCLDFHEIANVGHNLRIVRTYLKMKRKDVSQETQMDLQSPYTKAVDFYPEDTRVTSPKIAWIAIDLGASRSGYTVCGLSFISDLNIGNFETISICQFEEPLMTINPKSCLLFNAGQQLCYFGEEAMTKYKEFQNNGEADRWYFFDQYDKNLLDEKLTDKTKLLSANGNSMNACEVFGALTVYLINYLLRRLTDLDRANDIQLAYIVAETISTTCQSMLKSAAGKAGIDKDNVSIVSKTTSIIKYSEMYSLPQDEMIGQLPDEFWKPGYKFVTADLAYDQAKVSVHERLEDGTCRTIDKRLGEWGFQKCVSECIEVFPLLFGHDVYNEFIEKDPMWLDEVTREIESKWFKMTQERSNMNLYLPSTLRDLYKRKTSKNIGEEIQKLSKLLKVTMAGKRLRLKSSIMKTVVENCISGNTSLIKALLSKHRMSEANAIIFFGKFLENNEIKDAMTGNFDGAVIVSNNCKYMCARYANIKAGILYVFAKRVVYCPFTYGINCCGVLHNEVHVSDHQLRIVYNNKICQPLFRRYFLKGEKVNTGQLRFWRYRSVFPYQKKILVNILQSDRREPRYADRNEIKELDVITVNLGLDVEYGEIEVQMMFREIGLLVEAFTVQEGTLSKVYSKMFRHK